ncbi:MAG TPA: pyruvate carboxylase [Aestuariivirgaceae bacterium]|nr:pyruvate carboxylase [Aestuariivirgaceae bacterium]
MHQFTAVLAANRGEIAIRIFRAATELGIRTVAIYSNEDRFSLHRFKADESYLVGEGKGPIEAYLDIEDVIRIAKDTGVDAIHPGYGFLAESPEFAEACANADIAFIGPSAETLRLLGNKVSARALAAKAGVDVVPATGALPDDPDRVAELARAIGYPLMLKASWGGGGRGMRAVEREADLLPLVEAARAEARAAFGKDEVYLEKLVVRARHVEVQVIGDTQGNLRHLYERDCSVQRRNQKVVERAPAPYLDDAQRNALCEAGLKVARAAGYANAGTVEFLMDRDTGRFYFIEVNPRIQVEHTVTEVVTGIDIVKAQIRIAMGLGLSAPETGVPPQDAIRLNGHALQCRITTEDPLNAFIPDYGRIKAYRGATGFGIRLDGGTAYSGALVTRHYDSLLEKLTAWAPTPEEAVQRMERALREFRIRGVSTNLQFLEGLVRHPKFVSGDYTTRFIDETPELFDLPERRDRATKLLTYIAEVIVNGNPEVSGRPRPTRRKAPKAPDMRGIVPLRGLKQRLDAEGPQAVADYMKAENRLLVTDTTMRDAHQSLLATRMRTDDLDKIAPAYAVMLPELFSIECWGGATFDVAMRFLKECPWERLRRLRRAMPNHLLQMLLRSANAVGYTNYPDNVVEHFVARAAAEGIDIFRVFDSLNWTENMKVAMDAVLRSGRILEAAICYTGDILDPQRPKYDLDYYVRIARELKSAGAHILGIKDMAGLLKPEAARVLVGTLKAETGLPVHLHTHDTSGISAATVLAAAEAGVDAVDAAMDSMSGLTSQPPLGSIAAALERTPRATGLDLSALETIAEYWRRTRSLYEAFESEIRAGTADVYVHEMPGGQYTNLREQARSLGIEERWNEVSRAYAEVNRMFGDIIKVTPSSKVVGDMALMMVTSNISVADVVDPDRPIAFPESVVALFRGDIGRPHGGLPEGLAAKVLKGEKPLTVRPGAAMRPADLDALRREAEERTNAPVDDADFASYLMYPQVYVDFARARSDYGDLSILPTPVFFYGMELQEEFGIAIDKGKTLLVSYSAVGEPDEDAMVTVFFELNGQPRPIRVPDRSRKPLKAARPKADPGNAAHLSAPMPGLVVSIAVKPGERVKKGDVILHLEAMKMQTTVAAESAGVVKELTVAPGAQVDAKDLLAVIE